MTPAHAQKTLESIKTKPDSYVRLRVVGSIDNPDADGPGARLQNARRIAGLSVVQIAQALKLRPDQIAAIESMQFTRLPGLGFALGYVRGYAELLDLPDVKGIVEDFKTKWAPEQLRHEASRKTHNSHYALPIGIVFATAGLGFIIFSAFFSNIVPQKTSEIARPDDAIKVWAQNSIGTDVNPIVKIDTVTSLRANRAVHVTIYGEDGALVMERNIGAGESVSTDGLGRWFISTEDAGALSVEGYGFTIGLGDNYQKLDRFRTPDLAAMNSQKQAAAKKIADDLAAAAIAKTKPKAK